MPSLLRFSRNTPLRNIFGIITVATHLLNPLGVYVMLSKREWLRRHGILTGSCVTEQAGLSDETESINHCDSSARADWIQQQHIVMSLCCNIQHSAHIQDHIMSWRKELGTLISFRLLALAPQRKIRPGDYEKFPESVWWKYLLFCFRHKMFWHISFDSVPIGISVDDDLSSPARVLRWIGNR